MFSHVVIFWTKPDVPGAVDKLLAGAQKYLSAVPGALSFHVGKMVPSHRPVVEQSYQVALNILFADKAAQDAYQAHPLHLEFVEKAFKPNCAKCVVFDFA
ncbi:MAG: Dabb family protein [Kiritimatiellaeota bacterium]|nr:Dabb family protein [Kiritimatiellota bacterium]